MKKEKAFTLLEVILVIAMVTFVVIAGTTGYNSVRHKARVVVAIDELTQLRNIAVLAMAKTGKNLNEITESNWWTAGSCINRLPNPDLRNIGTPSNPDPFLACLGGSNAGNSCTSNAQCGGGGICYSACFVRQIAARDKIAIAAGFNPSDLSELDRDPWGSPYLYDENDGIDVCSITSPDLIYSAGPDGIDAQQFNGYDTDDYILSGNPKTWHCVPNTPCYDKDNIQNNDRKYILDIPIEHCKP